MTYDANLDAAYLRKVFNDACRSYPHHVLMPDEFRRWWSNLYAAVTTTDAGLELLKELQRLQDRVKELEGK